MAKQLNSANGSRQDVSLYLLRDHLLKEFHARFPMDSRNPLSNGLPFEGFFFPMQKDPETPDWLESIRGLLSTGKGVDLYAQHPGGVLHVEYKSKHFAFTFGHAWSALKQDWVDQDFGKRVALNAIPRDKLCELKAEQVFAAWHLSNERAPAPTSVARFGLDADRDLVHAIEGRPSGNISALLGATVRGSVGLKISIDFSRLKDVLDCVVDLEGKDDYKKIWPEIDNLVAVKDPSTIAVLDAQLDAVLKDPAKIKSIALIAPTLKNSDLPTPSKFWIGRVKRKGKSKKSESPYLFIHAWLSDLNWRKENPSLEAAHKTKVHFFDQKGDEIAKTQLYDCIAFEASLSNDGKTTSYILSAGRWYAASVGFIDRINTEISTLNAPAINPLKKWDGVVPEVEYNKSCVGAGSGLYLFDAKNVMFGGGQSKFEFCDIFDESTKTLFFIKHVGASNHCSHLGEQVRRTVELVFGPNDGFRAKLIEKITTLYPGMDVSWLKNRPKPGSLTLCLVSMGNQPSDFPFFAKCGLARLVKELNHGNHEVKFLTV